MAKKKVQLPLDISVDLVTVPGSSRIRIEMEGFEALGYDPNDGRFFAFGDPTRAPLVPDLSALQTRALKRHLKTYAAQRQSQLAGRFGPADATNPRPETDARHPQRSIAQGSVVDMRTWRARTSAGNSHCDESGDFCPVTTENIQAKGVLLYRVAPPNGGLVFAREDRARQVAWVHEAIKTSKTWTEFRRAIPRTEYLRVLHSIDQQGSTRPMGRDEFTGELLPGWSDGDYPTWLQPEMTHFIPEEVLERFGQLKSTPVNGSFWWIPPQAADLMCRELSEMGWICEYAPSLSFW